MAKSFDELVLRTTTERTRQRAAKRTEELLSESGTPMTQLILDDGQVEAVRNSADWLEARDSQGNLIAYLAKQPTATPEEIAEAKRRMNHDGPWHTTEQVVARLNALAEKYPRTPGRFVGKFSRAKTYTDAPDSES